MEKSDVMRRAMRQAAQYELPSEFTPRLMTRVRRRKRRREILETAAYLLGGTGCFAALIVGGIYAWSKYGGAETHTELLPKLPAMPEPPLPDIGAALAGQERIWLFMAAGFVILSAGDILLRRRLRYSNTEK